MSWSVDVVLFSQLGDQVLDSMILFHGNYGPTPQARNMMVMVRKYIRELNLILPTNIYLVDDVQFLKQRNRSIDTSSVNLVF